MRFTAFARLGVISLLPPAGGEWRPLFVGRDLAGWETYLGKPHAVPAEYRE